MSRECDCSEFACRSALQPYNALSRSWSSSTCASSKSQVVLCTPHQFQWGMQQGSSRHALDSVVMTQLDDNCNVVPQLERLGAGQPQRSSSAQVRNVYITTEKLRILGAHKLNSQPQLNLTAEGCPGSHTTPREEKRSL